MKKIICMLIAAAMLVIPAADGVQGIRQALAAEAVNAQEAVSIEVPSLNSKGYIPSRDFKIDVSITQFSDKTKYYTVKSEIGGVEHKTEQIIAKPNISVTKSIHVSNSKQGPVKIKVEIYSGNSLVKSLDKDIMVIEAYQKQFLDQYSGKGINGASPQFLDYYHLMGLQNARMGNEWYWIENKLGTYNWPSEYQQQLDGGEKGLYLSAYGNPLYSGENVDKKGPTTKAELDAYAKYTVEAMKRYPSIKYVELWNEPNISFWLPTPNLIDYMNLIKVASMELKKCREDLVITGGSIAVNDYKWINEMYEHNAFAYLDSLSTHPYGYPTGADEFLQLQLTSFDENCFEHGGWTENTSTEFGWPTHVGNRGITVDQQAIEAVKHYVITDYNDYTINQFYRMNDLAISGQHDDTYNEDNFGVVYYDGSPKPAVAAIKEVCQRTNGGQQLGKLEAPEGIESYIYIKDKKPVVVMWKKTNAPETCPDTYAFEESVTVYDMYGNRLSQGNEVRLTQTPVYIEGVTGGTAAKALSYTLKTKFDEKIQFLDEASYKQGFQAMKDTLYKGVEMTKLSDLPSEKEMMELLETYYRTVMDGMIDIYERGDFKGELMDLTSMLYIAQLGGVRIMNLYMMTVDEEEAPDVSGSRSYIEAADAFMKEKMGSGTLSYASAIRKFALELNEKLTDTAQSGEKNAMRAGVIKGWYKMVQLLSDLTRKVAAVEQVKHDNILLLMPSTQYQFDIGTKRTSNLLLYNYSEDNVSGTVELVDPSGEVVGKSAPISLSAGESTEVAVEVLLDTVYEENEKYTMRFGAPGTYLVDETAPIEVRTKVDVDLELIDTKFSEIRNVEVNIENLIDLPVNGTVSVEAPEGWALQKNTQEFEVNAGQKGIVSFPVTKKSPSPYHFYSFKISVTDNAGKTLFENSIPLSFSVVPKAAKELSTEGFNGQISDWSDAYPIYLGLPKDVNSYEAWQTSDIAARVLTKWDENYLYLLVDAFDNVHSQLKRGGEIWNGDCVQVSIDPNNDKDDEKYTAEDYEYGFAYSDQGGNIAYSWYKPNGNPGEESSAYSSMLRENSTRLSRYLIRLPKEAIAPLKLEEGTQFGYNVVLNDADFTDREKFIEYVPGTGAAKMPSLYPSYRLIGQEAPPSGKNVCPIPSAMTASDKVSENPPDASKDTTEVFCDIDGHWAQDTIVSFYEAGYINGVGDNRFEPERAVTRAEFIKMLVNAAGISKDAQSSQAGYPDVNAQDWFAGFVNAASNEGIIFSEMTQDGFKPNQPVTREEAIGMTGQLLLVQNKATGRKGLDTFSDGDRVSNWARTALEVAHEKGILQGDDNGRINPESFLTRAEAAVVLSRLK